jgi:hypothetical protein
MTSDAFRPEFRTETLEGVLAAGKSRVGPFLTFIGYAGVFLGYTTIFLISLFTVGFLEIRQANMTDFNALIAVLEQRDAYEDHRLDAALARFAKERDAHRVWIDSLVCYDIAAATAGTENGRAGEPGNHPEGSSANTKTCAEIKATLQRHANELSLTEDDVRFKSANLAFYYEQYKDGITQKTPQIIPALRLLDSKSPLLTVWARSPFELVEMFLLVCMGLLGGVLSVMRYFVDPSLKNPDIAEFFYKPAAGAAISLGVYVLFRAAQIFLGVQDQPGGTASTSIFLLAGLGLASGFCATEALAQIEFVATRLLRRGQRDEKGSAGTPRGAAPDREGGANSAPSVAAAAAATPG